MPRESALPGGAAAGWVPAANCCRPEPPGSLRHRRPEALPTLIENVSRQLLEEAGSRQEVIVTFLVVLELMKNGSVEVTQEENFGEIMIDTKEETLSGVGLEESLSEYE